MGTVTRVTIVRHGETDWNKAGIVQGHADIPLNQNGEAQARIAARWFRQQGVRWEAAYSSDLVRARRTAELILEQHEGEVELKLDERIRERHLGNLQGKRRGDPGTDPSTVEPIAVLRARLWSFWDELFPSPPPGHSAQSASSSLPSPSTSTPRREVLYVSHGAAIRDFIRSIVEERIDRGGRGGNRGQEGWEWELALPKEEEDALRSGSKRIDNCSRTVIEVEEVEQEQGRAFYRARLLLYADDSHFDDASRAPSPTANADVVE
ncbi:hypothetical protein JCM8097_006038 [Rhodosporidiobolus ruineniae]